MTENEAIKGLAYLISGKSNQYPPDYDFHIQVAIKALEEIQQYRSIGTVEECNIYKRIAETTFSTACLDMKIIDELHEYKNIGTVEECREAVECRKTKRMTNKVRCMTIIDAESYPDTSGSCPKCGYRHYEGKIGTKYCPWCGQAILWEERED